MEALPQGVHALLAQCEQALEDCSFEEATSGFERCRELYAAVGDLRGEAYALHRLAQVASRTGRLLDAKALYLAARDRHRLLGETLGIADVTHSLADVERQLGNDDLARELYQEAVDLFRNSGDVGGTVDVLTSLGDFEASRGAPRVPVARAAYEEALQLARTDVDDRGVPGILFSLAETFRMTNDCEEARRLYIEAAELAERADSFGALADASRGRAILEWTAGDLTGARESIVQAIRAYDEQKDVPSQIESRNLRGEIELALGDPHAAHRTFEVADRMAVDAGFQQGRVYALAGLGKESLSRGDAVQAVAYLEQARKIARTLHLPMYEATVMGDLGLARRCIDVDAGERTIDEALGRFEALGMAEAARWLREERGVPASRGVSRRR